MEESADVPSPSRTPAPCRASPSGPPPVQLDDVRVGVESLANSEPISKDAALEIFRLFHAMEMLMRYECTQRERRIAELQSQLQIEMVRNALADPEPLTEAPPPVANKRRW